LSFLASFTLVSPFIVSFGFLLLSFSGDFLVFLSWTSLLFLVSLLFCTGYYLAPFLSDFTSLDIKN
jgi:hypothetical protein